MELFNSELSFLTYIYILSDRTKAIAEEIKHMDFSFVIWQFV